MSDMSRPVRLRLSRAKGFDLQALSRATNGLDAVKVARPGPFGNPFTLQQAADVFDCRREAAHTHAVHWFRQWLNAADEAFEDLREYSGMKADRDELVRRLPELRGKNLACFCAPDFTCHAGVLLEIANRKCEEVG